MINMSSITVENTTANNNIKIEDALEWTVLDSVLVIYSLTILISTIKKHKHHFEPVHLLTLSALINIIMSFVIYLITDILTLIWSNPDLYEVCKIIDNSLWFCFYLDVVAGDLNGSLFAKLDHVTYHEWINNNKTIVILGKESFKRLCIQSQLKVHLVHSGIIY